MISSPVMKMEQRRVVALNNNGIRLFQQGRHRQALPSLLQSLQHMKELRKRPLPATTAVVSDEDKEDVQAERPSLFQLQPLSSSSTSSASSPSISLPFEMFQQVFALCQEGEDVTSVANRDGASAAIMYNLAVVHHSRGLDLLAQNKSARLSLTKALQLYTYALSGIQQWAKGSTTKVPQGIHILRLAILNNMAHANALLAHKRCEAQHCLQCLREVLPHAKGRVSQEHYAFFSANVVVLCLQQQQDNNNNKNAGESTGSTWVLAPAAAA